MRMGDYCRWRPAPRWDQAWGQPGRCMSNDSMRPCVIGSMLRPARRTLSPNAMRAFDALVGLQLFDHNFHRAHQARLAAWWEGRASLSPPVSGDGFGADRSSLVVPRIVDDSDSYHPFMVVLAHSMFVLGLLCFTLIGSVVFEFANTIDFVGEPRSVLRAVPCRTFLFSDGLPTQLPVPVSLTESWDCHAYGCEHECCIGFGVSSPHVSALLDCRPGQGFVLFLPARQSLSPPGYFCAVLCRYREEP
jgi:hypothetical protein